MLVNSCRNLSFIADWMVFWVIDSLWVSLFVNFSKFDLYSKSDALPDIEALKPYYQSLIDKYIPGKIKF